MTRFEFLTHPPIYAKIDLLYTANPFQRIMMKRKQIYISEEVEKKVKELAVLRGVPEAAVVREALERYIAKSTRKKSEKGENRKENPLRKLIGLFNKGPRDASINLDHYLYGAPKKK